MPALTTGQLADAATLTLISILTDTVDPDRRAAARSSTPTSWCRPARAAPARRRRPSASGLPSNVDAQGRLQVRSTAAPATPARAAITLEKLF
jgi:hypothetical protein